MHLWRINVLANLRFSLSIERRRIECACTRCRGTWCLSSPLYDSSCLGRRLSPTHDNVILIQAATTDVIGQIARAGRRRHGCHKVSQLPWSALTVELNTTPFGSVVFDVARLARAQKRTMERLSTTVAAVFLLCLVGCNFGKRWRLVGHLRNCSIALCLQPLTCLSCGLLCIYCGSKRNADLLCFIQTKLRKTKNKSTKVTSRDMYQFSLYLTYFTGRCPIIYNFQ